MALRAGLRSLRRSAVYHSTSQECYYSSGTIENHRRPSAPVHCFRSSSSFHFTCSRLSSTGAGTAANASSKVVLAKDDEHYDEIMKDVKSKGVLGVVYFTAQWCGPCKQIAPYIDELSQQFNDVTFVKVDVDKLEVERTMTNSQIGVVPTFHFHKRGKRVGEITGAVKDKLKHLVESLRSE